MNPLLTTLLTVVTASLVGSLHCAAMCGGLVSFTCGSSDNPRLAQLFYHASRLGAYGSLGAIAGFVGQSLNERIDVAGYQNLSGLIGGSAMIGWALFALTRRWRAKHAAKALVTPELNSERLLALSGTKRRRSHASIWFARVHALPSVLRGTLLGLTSAILPCGWLYAFVTAAAGQGDPARGALLMSAFWLGTLPMLVGLGSLVSLLGSQARQYLPRVSIVILLTLGLGTIAVRYPRAHSGHDSSPQSPPPHSCH
jgi:sulfite exporter TauE/SafE